MKKNNIKGITVRFKLETYEKLERVSESNNTTVTEEVRKFTEEGLKIKSDIDELKLITQNQFIALAILKHLKGGDVEDVLKEAQLYSDKVIKK